MRAEAREAVSDPDNTVFISAASAWEITTKHRIGKLPGARALARFRSHCLAAWFRPLPITLAHGELGGRLAGAHKDPFDRILIAQALIEPLTLVSNESVFDACGVMRLW